MNNSYYLSRIVIFDCLSPEDLMQLEQNAAIEHMDVIPRNTLIQTPDERLSGLYFVKEGKLRLFKLNPEGKSFTLDILGMGNMFGDLEAMSLGTGDIFIETMENTRLCLLANDRFERLISERPQMAIRLIRLMGEVLKEREELLTSLAIGNMTERVLQVLLKLCKQFGLYEDGFHRIGMRLTHQEIADMVGIRRESVTVILKQLAKEGVVRTRRQSILVHMDRAQSLLKRPLDQRVRQKSRM